MKKHFKALWRNYGIYIKKIALLIFPAVFLIVAILIHFSIGKFYMVGTDPEYFHLFNGLNLAIFNLAVDYIHHPGTTIQMIYAFSAHIVNLVQPANGLITNALDHPEEFIHGANILLNLITSLTMVLLGFYTWKYTGHFFLALLMQFMPFGSSRILLISGRLLPETALLVPLMILALLMVKYIFDDNTPRANKKYLVGFAIAGGLGMAGKFLYLPFLLIPLFILPSVKKRLRYMLYTFIAVLIFAFPIFANLGKSWSWFGNMLLHSGNWGTGETNFMDLSLIPERLGKLFNMDESLFIILGLAVVQIILFYSMAALRKTNTVKLLLRSLMAVVVSLMVSALLVTKHFEFHYFVPGLAFKSFILFLMTGLMMELITSKRIRYVIPVAAFAVMALLMIPQISDLKTAVSKNRERAESLEERVYLLSKYDVTSRPLIITSHYSGTPFKQSALVDGFLQSGHLKSTFTEHLTAKYPNTYFYVGWSEQFYLWDQFVDARNFVAPGTPVYLFIGEGREANLDKITARINNDLPGFRAEITLLHHFKNPDEYFYKLEIIDDE